MKTQQNQKYDAICKSCGSNDIDFDCFAAWDANLQEYSIKSVMDDGHACNGCGLSNIVVEWIRIG